MEKFVNPLIDIIFKTMWIRADDDLKIYFNRLLSYALKREIKDYHIGSNETGVINANSSATKVDILLENDEEKIDIELNNITNKSGATPISAMLNKSIIYLSYYGTTFYDNDKFNRYKKEIKVEQINLNNFYCLDNIAIERLDYKFVDVDHEISKNGIESHHIYLPRMKELCYTTNEEIYKDYAMLVCKSYEEMEELVGNDPGRQAFVSMLKKLGREDEFMTVVDKEEFEQIIREAEKQDSKDEGIKEGIEQGIQEGIDLAKKEIVNKLIGLGYPKDEIKKITELTDEEIDNYIKQD